MLANILLGCGKRFDLLHLLGLVLLIRVDTGGELLSDFRVSVDIVCVGEDLCRVVGVVLGFLLGFLLVFESLFLFVDLGTKFLLTGFGVFASGV